MQERVLSLSTDWMQSLRKLWKLSMGCECRGQPVMVFWFNPRFVRKCIEFGWDLTFATDQWTAHWDHHDHYGLKVTARSTDIIDRIEAKITNV